MVKRMIATIRSAHHGGAVIFLQAEDVGELRTDPNLLRMKYEFAEEEPRHRSRTLILRALAAVAVAGAASGHVEPVGWSFYETAADPEISRVEEAMFEMAHTIAGFADVDGGAEIGALADVHSVRRAKDVEGTRWEEESVLGVGTRHRSAYRFCHRFRRAVAILVSQDGNVRFVAWHEGAVTVWDHASAGWVDT
jgi:hypothetical protein